LINVARIHVELIMDTQIYCDLFLTRFLMISTTLFKNLC